MTYIKIDDDTYAVEATPDPQAVVSKSALIKEIADLQEGLDAFQNPTQEQLLDAYKEWHRFSDLEKQIKERKVLLAELEKI